MPTICLSMIVKNEEHCIVRCLESVKPYISHWVICDTGSTDATKERILATLGDVPGQLQEAEWVDFATNRNIPLAAALASGADYVLSLDADEWLETDDPEWVGKLTGLSYMFISDYLGNIYLAHRLVHTSLPWAWEGVIHEFLTTERDPDRLLVPDVVIYSDNIGARSADPEEAKKDIAVLEYALARDPGNARYQFYLALTLIQDRQLERAVEELRKRCLMKGKNEDEIFFCHYQAGACYLQLGKPQEALIRLRAAYGYNPSRAEPLFLIGMHYFNGAAFGGALAYFELCLHKNNPRGLFVESSIYEYRALYQFALTAAALKLRDDATAAARQCLEYEDLTEDERSMLRECLDPLTYE